MQTQAQSSTKPQSSRQALINPTTQSSSPFFGQRVGLSPFPEGDAQTKKFVDFYAPMGEGTSTFTIHSANCFVNESRIAVALPRDFFQDDVELVAHGFLNQQEQGKRTPLRMQAPQKATSQTVAAIYGYQDKNYGMTPPTYWTTTTRST